MANVVKHILFALALVICIGLEYITSQDCVSPQYLKLGKPGSVICSFEEGFYGVYWYNSTDNQQEYPIAYLSGSTKGGIGYTSEQFDIFANGSLLIHNVSLTHDHEFTVAYLQSQRDPKVWINVLVVVVVIPATTSPIILNCGEETSAQNCLLEIEGPVALTCLFQDSRPAVELTWMRRKLDGDEEMFSTTKTLTEGICYTSYETTELSFSHSLVLVLLACRGSSPTGMLERSESFVLVQSAMLDLAGVHQTHKIFPRFSQMILVCTERQINAFVWKKVAPSLNASGNILYSAAVGENVNNTIDDDFYLGERNSLTLPHIDIHHEGVYACVYTDGIVADVALYNVSVMVHPVPPNPVIEGCNSNDNDDCTLEVNRDGVLTCSMQRIRPEVQLAWSAYYESDDDFIVFTNHKSHVRENENLFDVSLTVTYTVKKFLGDKITVKCHGVGIYAEYFQLTKKVDLLLLYGAELPSEPTNAQNVFFISLLFTILATVIGLIVLVIVIFCRRHKGKRLTTSNVGEEARYTNENVPMITIQSSGHSDQTRKRKILTQQLKQRYQDLYNGVTLVPYKADEMQSVDTVFTECVIEHLFVKQGAHDKWEKVSSYKEVFTKGKKRSTRRILYGEPGYGKSIVCLKVAFDWCNNKLNNTELLVLLHLKHLGSVNSIYTAIRRYILPKDTPLSEGDIANILSTCKSVLVILDGFDEYLLQDTNTVTDVGSIISRRMFQEFTVVVTTRANFDPTNYPPQTEVYRLTGFDESTIETYIEKVVNDEQTARTVQDCIKENHVLQDLSQVPFLLACFVSMIQEGNRINLTKSVTEIFRQIIICFHNHARSKREFDDVTKYKDFQRKHSKLDEITFNALSEYKRRIVWRKDELTEEVGLDFYKHYAQIGILVEEEGTGFIDSHDTESEDKDIAYTDVSFVHKLFCEWYAAHHLCLLSKIPSANMEKLVKNIDPINLQYVYRFACGIDFESAKKLIEYLPKLKGGNKCAIVCIQEQIEAADVFEDTISQICRGGIIISKHDSMLLQRSSFALLKKAAEKKININGLCLYNCLESVDHSGITTYSGAKLTAEIPVERLKINVTDRNLSENEAINILNFSLTSDTINYIKFGNCVPPERIVDDTLRKNLKEKKITVKWRLDFDREFYTLDLDTGKWREDPPKDQKDPQKDQKSVQLRPLTHEEYEELREQHQKTIPRETEAKCKNDVEAGREILRSKQVEESCGSSSSKNDP